MFVCLSLCVCVFVFSLQFLINGNLNWYVITGLKPLTEYEVSLSGMYRDESESEAAEISESTGESVLD